VVCIQIMCLYTVCLFMCTLRVFIVYSAVDHTLLNPLVLLFVFDACQTNISW
jgi:hypothetical protein